MEDKGEGEENAPRGADWEVVSLTASAYAAAPGPDKTESKYDDKGEVVDKNKGETSNELFMSGHFVFPPNQHENLPLDPENTEIVGEQEGEDVSESVKEEGEKSDAKEEVDWNLQKLTESEDFHEIPFFDEKGNRLAISDADIADSTTLAMGASNMDDDDDDDDDDDEDRVLAESVESSDLPKHTEEDKYGGSGVPYAAWWKKQASSLYGHAKEANTFWSIFIAAAVMGLVILGQQWQQERWQVLYHKWHSGVGDEKFRRMLGPMSRLKDAVVGGNRRGFSLRGTTTREH